MVGLGDPGNFFPGIPSPTQVRRLTHDEESAVGNAGGWASQKGEKSL